MRISVVRLLAVLIICENVAVFGWASGEIGGVQGGSYQSAILQDENVQYGDLKTTIQRHVVQVPAAYGKLMQITSWKGGTVLWFQNDDGTIRNVMLTGNELWAIQRKGSTTADQ